MPFAAPLESLAAVLGPSQDLLVGRVDAPEPPAWCRRRGWDGWLLGLSDERLAALESGEGAALPALLEGAPDDLRALARQPATGTAWLAARPAPADDVGRPGMSPRKAGQVEALSRLVARTAAGVTRVVDAGAGLGHLTRDLGRTLGLPVLGLEADPARAARARGLTADAGVAFAAARVERAELRAGPDTLLVGLHACGALGDELVVAAAEGGAGLVLVGCCLQQRETPTRPPLSRLGQRLGLEFERAVLGLSNLRTRAHGVAGDTAAVMAGRERRHALRRLLQGRGLEVELGAEMRGLVRRHLDRGLAHAAQRALARRGLPGASARELDAAAALARREFGAMRRLSVPRLLLGRLLELAVVLDRAQALAEAGHGVSVVPAFAESLSPRNLAVVAAPRTGRDT